MASSDTVFTGSIPALYDRYLGPLIFEPYAREVVRRLGDLKSGSLLETAAGTGIVTEALARGLPEAVSIVATDLNQAMVDHAAAKPGTKRVTFRQADALKLPFADASFDAAVCQFGAMFFPDRVAGYREMHRVLRPGGRALVLIWSDLANNIATRAVVDSVGRQFPANPPRFLARTPHGHGDVAVIRRELGEAGFARVDTEVVRLASRGTARDVATGFCQGTPMRAEIEALAPQGLQDVTDKAAADLTREFGAGAFEAPIQAVIATAVK